tara:strand:+ start:606 stop:1634 length:1029 start_codon:yes stop_codon:yes gene_type:complete
VTQPAAPRVSATRPALAVRLVPILILLVGWLATGFYIVRGNEQAVVRRFGRLVRNESGAARISDSGLRWDLPWPLSRVDRVNTHEIRTLAVGLPEFGPELEGDSAEAFLQDVDPTHQSQFLTGDRNILNLQVTVHYHVGSIDRYLFGESQPENRLRAQVESLVADTISASGVDFVLVNGRHRLRNLLVTRAERIETTSQTGLTIDDITVGAVYPPIQAKADFLAVMNARAERETHINNARAYAGKRAFEQDAAADQIKSDALAYRTRTISSARAQADRFNQLVNQIQRDSQSGELSYTGSRQLAMRRMYARAVGDIFSKVAAKVILDSGKPVDLTIIKSSER